VAIDLDAASAAMRLSNWAIPDYTDIFNSAGLTDPPLATIPSTVSFDARWRGKPGATLTSIRDASRSFVGEFIDSLATIAWTAQQPSTHFAFTSAPAASSTTVSGVIGRERNGRFFS
jgi:hypothetical protein